MGNFEFYAYLDIENPMVAWEVAIGRIKSYCDRNPENIGLSVWQYNLLRQISKNGIVNKITHEFNLEARRRKYYASKVSRLNGVYFFESESMAHQALDRWGLSKKKKYISKVNFSADNLTRYDSEWITAFGNSGASDWYEGYLSGETLGVKPLIEVIASGIGMVCSIPLRQQAYKIIYDKWPTSTPLLASAVAGFRDVGIEDVALIRPFLKLENGKLCGEHIIYMESLRLRQVEVYEAMVRLKRNNTLPAIAFDSIERGLMTLPDFSALRFELSIPDAASTFSSIHDF